LQDVVVAKSHPLTDRPHISLPTSSLLLVLLIQVLNDPEQVTETVAKHVLFPLDLLPLQGLASAVSHILAEGPQVVEPLKPLTMDSTNNHHIVNVQLVVSCQETREIFFLFEEQYLHDVRAEDRKHQSETLLDFIHVFICLDAKVLDVESNDVRFKQVSVEISMSLYGWPDLVKCLDVELKLLFTVSQVDLALVNTIILRWLVHGFRLNNRASLCCVHLRQAFFVTFLIVLRVEIL
jgi:hypothetical protein